MMLAMDVTLATSWNVIGGMAGYPSLSRRPRSSAWAPMPGRWRKARDGRCRSPGPPGERRRRACRWRGRLGGAAGCRGGHYFAIASLAVVIVLRHLTTNWTGLTGGGMGLNLPVLQSSPEAQALIFYAGQAVVALIAIGVAALGGLLAARLLAALHPAERDGGQHARVERAGGEGRGVSRCRRRWPARRGRSTPPTCPTSSRATCSTSC